MTSNFKQRFKSTCLWAFGLYTLLFAFRLIYGYVAVEPHQSNDSGGNFFSSNENIRKNYASEKSSMNVDSPMTMDMASNQKFEKTATIRTKSSDFEHDEALLQQKANRYHAVIQYEKNQGQKGSRQIHMSIGVNPMLFDSLYRDLLSIGELKATEITKVDKTNEYRELNAKKTSIENALRNLNELKLKSGQLGEYVALNDKILEIEAQAQELGVELGNFDTENEFCTVMISMNEGAIEQGVSFIHRLKVAFEWSIKYFCYTVSTALVMLLSVFVLLLVVDKLKVIGAIRSKINKDM